MEAKLDKDLFENSFIDPENTQHREHIVSIYYRKLDLVHFLGTGTIIGVSHIITCTHVVIAGLLQSKEGNEQLRKDKKNHYLLAQSYEPESEQYIFIRDFRGNTVTGISVLAADSQYYDLAILKLSKPLESQPLPFIYLNRSNVKRDDLVGFLVGFPSSGEGLASSYEVPLGFVSGPVNDEQNFEKLTPKQSIEKGCSGSALVIHTQSGLRGVGIVSQGGIDRPQSVFDCLPILTKAFKDKFILIDENFKFDKTSTNSKIKELSETESKIYIVPYGSTSDPENNEIILKWYLAVAVFIVLIISLFFIKDYVNDDENQTVTQEITIHVNDKREVDNNYVENKKEPNIIETQSVYEGIESPKPFDINKTNNYTKKSGEITVEILYPNEQGNDIYLSINGSHVAENNSPKTAKLLSGIENNLVFIKATNCMFANIKVVNPARDVPIKAPDSYPSRVKDFQKYFSDEHPYYQWVVEYCKSDRN